MPDSDQTAEPPEFGWTEGTPPDDLITEPDDPDDAESYIGDPLEDEV
jgi:hypothetical protein